MAFQPQLKIPATYMRGGTSKGVFFKLTDLPDYAQSAGMPRDKLLQRVIGSPDPYAKHTDGMGGATSSTSKVVIVSKSNVANHDVDYLFGQVAIEDAVIDWSGNCGNLSSAVGPFAISNGLIDPALVPENGICTVRIWQANIKKTIISNVLMVDGLVQETGNFELDGVAFPASEIELDFIKPVDADDSMFPTGNVIDELIVPDNLITGGKLNVTLINAGIPTMFVDASDLGYQGTELQDDINSVPIALARLEALRTYGALSMGLIDSLSDPNLRQHIPKIAFVAPPQDYTASSGKPILATEIDLVVRALSMGKLHHAMMGTAAVSIATAAAIPGTLVNIAAGGGTPQAVRFGHPSGTLKVGATTSFVNGEWLVEKVTMSRSARVLMEGAVRVPALD